MSNIDVEKIRNIAVTGHAKAGKTTLVEAMLHSAGAINRMGKVEDGSTTTDYEPEETDRQISLSSALAFCQWKGNRVNIIDTPGFINFLEDTKGSMRAADGVVLMVKTGHVNRDMVQKAVEQLQMAQANVIGVVLNEVDIKREGYYKYYHKYYSRYYGDTS